MGGISLIELDWLSASSVPFGSKLPTGSSHFSAAPERGSALDLGPPGRAARDRASLSSRGAELGRVQAVPSFPLGATFSASSLPLSSLGSCLACTELRSQTLLPRQTFYGTRPGPGGEGMRSSSETLTSGRWTTKLEKELRSSILQSKLGAPD